MKKTKNNPDFSERGLILLQLVPIETWNHVDLVDIFKQALSQDTWLVTFVSGLKIKQQREQIVSTSLGYWSVNHSEIWSVLLWRQTFPMENDKKKIDFSITHFFQKKQEVTFFTIAVR